MRPFKNLTCAGLYRNAAAAALTSALVAAQAAPMTVSSSGTYDASAPTSFFTAPSATWSFSFTVDDQPVPLPAPFTETLFFTTVPFSNFSFLLGGVAILTPASYVAFYNVANGGGMDVGFGDLYDPLAETFALSFYGSQMYSGDEFTPTILAGIYSPSGGTSGTGFDIVLNSSGRGQPGADVVISAVPAPSALLLCVTTLGLLAAGRRRAASSGV